jgi:hypothetical protein
MGLLDLLNSDQGLLGMSLLAASAPQARRVGLGEGLLQGLQAVQTSRNAREDREMRKQQFSLQQQQAQLGLQQLQQQIAEGARQAQRQRAMEELPAQFMRPGQLPPTMDNRDVGQPGEQQIPAQQFDMGGYANALFKYDPRTALALQASMRKDTTPIKLGKGEKMFGPDGRLLFGNEDTPDLPSAVREYQFAVGQGYKGNFADWSREQANLKAPKTNLQVTMPFETEFKKQQGKEFSDMLANINKSGFAAPQHLRRLERMEQLLQGVDGGKLAPTGMEVASYLNSVGIKVDPRLGNKEAAQALAREMAGDLRQPGTGPMTDKDFDNFLQQMPDLSKSAEGRKQITATLRAKANRDAAVAKMAREYQRKNGTIDNDFLDQAAQFIAENPVVAAPAGWKVSR